ncbi:MAG: hypothetical protein ABEI53_02100 [Candidatus Magasanikbacteria bacterium]
MPFGNFEDQKKENKETQDKEGFGEQEAKTLDQKFFDLGPYETPENSEYEEISEIESAVGNISLQQHLIEEIDKRTKKRIEKEVDRLENASLDELYEKAIDLKNRLAELKEKNNEIKENHDLAEFETGTYRTKEAPTELKFDLEGPEDIKKLGRLQEAINLKFGDLYEESEYKEGLLSELKDIIKDRRLQREGFENEEDLREKIKKLSDERFDLRFDIRDLEKNKSFLEKLGLVENQERLKKLSDKEERFEKVKSKIDKLKNIEDSKIPHPEGGVIEFDSSYRNTPSTFFVKHKMIENTNDVVKNKISDFFNKKLENLAEKDISEIDTKNIENKINNIKDKYLDDLISEIIKDETFSEENIELIQNYKNWLKKVSKNYMDDFEVEKERLPENIKKKEFDRFWDLHTFVRQKTQEFFEEESSAIKISNLEKLLDKIKSFQKHPYRRNIQEKVEKIMTLSPLLEETKKNVKYQEAAEEIGLSNKLESKHYRKMAREIGNIRKFHSNIYDINKTLTKNIDMDFWLKVRNMKSFKSFMKQENIDLRFVNNAIERGYFYNQIIDDNGSEYHLKRVLKFSNPELVPMTALEIWSKFGEDAEEIPKEIESKLESYQEYIKQKDFSHLSEKKKRVVNILEKNNDIESFLDVFNSPQGSGIAEDLLTDMYERGNNMEQDFVEKFIKRFSFGLDKLSDFCLKQIEKDSHISNRILKNKIRYPENSGTFHWVMNEAEDWLKQRRDIFESFMAGLYKVADNLEKDDKDKALNILLEKVGNVVDSISTYSNLTNLERFIESFSDKEQEMIVNKIIRKGIKKEPDNPKGLIQLADKKISYMDEKTKEKMVDVIEGNEDIVVNHSLINSFLSLYENTDKDKRFEIRDKIFELGIQEKPGLFKQLYTQDNFPFSEEQLKIMEIMNKIWNSPSKSMKNLGIELAEQITSKVDIYDTKALEEAYQEIEDIFVKNNIPFVGKQYKVFEVLNPDKRLEKTNFGSPILSEKSNNKRRLIIFKDLLKGNIESLNRDLEKYAQVIAEGQEVLDKYEQGVELSAAETKDLESLLIKIETLSENIQQVKGFEDVDFKNLDIDKNIKALRKNFKVQDDETISEKFSRTFIQRSRVSGLENLSDLIKFYDDHRKKVTKRNRQNIENGSFNLEEKDLAKGVQLRFFHKQINRGFYSPEFVGAETEKAKKTVETGDQTPFDSDVIEVGERDLNTVVKESRVKNYGDITLFIKDRNQFNRTDQEKAELSEDKLELFSLGRDHRGIRTGFGSSQIDALAVSENLQKQEERLDSIKFSIARQGFYIPITDETGEVIFDYEEFEEYRDIFSGIERYHGGEIELSSEWKGSDYASQIENIAQTEENIEKIENLRDDLYKDIEKALNEVGIELTKGRNKDSLIGAHIIDTGSTGRGTALDIEDGVDFDFVVKLNDRDYEKFEQVGDKLEEKYPLDDDYPQDNMHMYRFLEFEHEETKKKISLDVGFVKRSEYQTLDAQEAVSQKYDSIKGNYGKEKWLEVLSNVRFAKKKLKEAECYKPSHKEGGLGGIGVENWVLKNGGDVIKAFKEFYKNSFNEDGEIIPFEKFKENYKIFSAGENIRGNEIAENFVEGNMTRSGYKKMAKLSEKIAKNS